MVRESYIELLELFVSYKYNKSDLQININKNILLYYDIRKII